MGPGRQAHTNTFVLECVIILVRPVNIWGLVSYGCVFCFGFVVWILKIWNHDERIRNIGNPQFRETATALLIDYYYIVWVFFHYLHINYLRVFHFLSSFFYEDIFWYIFNFHGEGKVTIQSEIYLRWTISVDSFYKV